ncbi:MAG: hypothetical protein O3A25_01770 [Acidobacteria bacterium]|nr:hypothetical protein [Acidobacteriota bacterium]
MMYRGMVAAVIGVGALVGLAGSAVAQDAPAGWTVPRTAEGTPDLQGVWANNSVTPLERPPQWAGKTRLTDEELANLQASAAAVVASGADAQFGDQLVLKALEGLKDAGSYDTTGNYNQFWMADRDFTHQTSLVIDPPDGQVPAVTDAAQRKMDERAAYLSTHPADGPEDRPLGERCANFGVPRLGAGYNSYIQIFQTPSHAAVLKEMAHDVAMIPLDGSGHAPAAVRFWNGDSRGRWEGDTLVVESANFSPKSSFQGSSDGLHLVERYTRVGPDSLHYEVTISDPATWVKPWTLLIQLKRSDDAIFEYACHEGNLGMDGILSGHRAEERAATAETNQGQ